MSPAAFIEIVRFAEFLPLKARQHAHEITDLRKSQIDASYIEFLDSQILLSPRGPEWTSRLINRRAALHCFCGDALYSTHVTAGDSFYSIYVDPRTESVVHWEVYEE